MMSNFVARLGRVVTVESVNDNDNANGLRIKVNLESPKSGQPEKLPWCFPLIPKIFQTVPKKGECVLVLFDEAGSTNGQWYYIGPIISQPQFQEKCEYDEAVALLKYGQQKPLPAIPKGRTTAGAFPEPTDVAVVGRGTEDIIKSLDFDNESESDRSSIIELPKIDN